MSQRVTDIADLIHAWEFENLLLAGQPGARAWDGFKQREISLVINMRAESEADFSGDQKTASELGMAYHQIPILSEGKLSSEASQKVSELVNDHKDKKILIHCGSANRVAGWLIVHLTKNGMDFNSAVEIAKQNGLTNPGFIEQAEDILSN